MGQQALMVEVFCFYFNYADWRCYRPGYPFPTEENVVVTKSKHNPKSKINTQALDGDTNIEIDNTGIHIKKTTANGKTRQIEIEGNNNQGQTNPNDTPTPPTPADSNNEATINVGASEKDIHIALPPDVAKEIGDD